MTAAERRKEEQELLLLSRKNRILEASFKLFSEKGIDTIAMTDIAKNAEIGVASLYRYYATKDEIAIQTAIWAWNEQSQNILPEISMENFSSKNGFEQLNILLEFFITLAEKQQDFLRFIYFFDSYAVRQHISTERMNEYENEISKVQDYVLKAIRKGIGDKSIKEKYSGNEDVLYFSIMHALFSSAQKLCLSSSLLEMDKNYSPSTQIEFLIKIIMSELKA